ncbi:MAG: hypothetical protein K6F61_00690 [Clostridiales bacterium]|nr:hypothetical protein [Clostridiales bacterium]
MFSVSPEIYEVLSAASRWLFAFFALMLLFFAFSWYHSDRKERRDRFKNLPGAGTVGELVVLSGSSELPVDTWFPVPREGILGSLRSCDLVVPCSGVRSQHLDFSWQDGTGLLIRPRIGCEVLVDGVPVSRRGAYADTPLLHGSLLQVGDAVLRLQLFSALSHTNRSFSPQAPVPDPGSGSWMPPAQPTVQPPVQDPYAASQPWTSLPLQGLVPDQAPPVAEQYPPQPLPDQPQQPEPPQAGQRRSRADRWKEDWSE